MAYHRTLALTFGLIFSLLSGPVAAVTVEAQGQALISGKDLEAARMAAIRNASEQALLQAGAYISSTQQLSRGVMQVDNLEIRSRGSLSNIRILEERREGDLLVVRIRADADTESSCPPEASGQRFRKSIAVAGFPLAHPEQASLGGLDNAPSALSRYLSDAINDAGNLRTLNASHLQMQRNLQTAVGSQWPDGALTDALHTFDELDVQYVISGVIRDLAMVNPTTTQPENILKDLYDRIDYRGRQHLRNFTLDLFVHDGATGSLLLSKRYQLLGLWNLDSHLRTGFATPAFFATDFGRQVQQLLDQVGRELDGRLKCEPLRARVLKTERNAIQFNAGSQVGVRPGDRFQVYRKRTFYDEQQRARIRLEKTLETLVVNQVQPEFSEGKISQDTRESGIQQDDILVAW